jgi:hypothetical protein
MTLVAMLFGDRVLRNPITGDVGCCARAASGHATAVPPRSAMNLRRFNCILPLPAGLIAGYRIGGDQSAGRPAVGANSASFRGLILKPQSALLCDLDHKVRATDHLQCWEG